MIILYTFNEPSSSSHNSLRLKKIVGFLLQVEKLSLRGVISTTQVLTEIKWQSQESELSCIPLQNVFLNTACSCSLHLVLISSSSSLPQGRMDQNPVAKSLVSATCPDSRLAWHIQLQDGPHLQLNSL